MTTNRVGAEYTYGTVTYRIGDRVYANDQSYYNGLYGEIVEISTDDDQGTENQGPDIICRFDEPVFPKERKKLEQLFSDVYRTPKTIDELGLDYVIMAPDMLDILYEHRADVCKLPIYRIMEEWVLDGDEGSVQSVFTDKNAARDLLCRKLAEDLNEGISFKLSKAAGFTDKYLHDYYECWLEDSYYQNHYRICLVSDRIPLSPEALRIAAECHTNECHKEDFISHVAEWEDASDLSDEQYQCFIRNPNIPSVVEDRLRNNERYWEAFWDSVSSAASILLTQVKKEDAV